VLVVDDCHDTANSLAVLLGLLGYEARTAYDGPAALLLAAASLPEVVLLDLGLPAMDGYAVARRLREAEGSRAAQLVAVTGYGQEADRGRCHEEGFDFFLLKPYEPTELADVLAACVAEAQGKA
jgi:CheY-like chemotaxis protein